jgi:hypothetical protein
VLLVDDDVILALGAEGRWFCGCVLNYEHKQFIGGIVTLIHPFDQVERLLQRGDRKVAPDAETFVAQTNGVHDLPCPCPWQVSW